jgi:Tfp pilus assembly protein PilF
VAAPPSPQLRAALTAHSRGDLTQAERLYRLVLASDPQQFEALHNLGHVLVQQGRPAQAVGCFERALARNPNAAGTHNMLASALRGMDRYEEAIDHHQRALALRPGYAQAHHDLGRLLLGLGRIDEARRSLETAVDLAPQRGGYYRSLSEAVRFTEGDARLAAMEALSREPALPPVDRVELHFALGKAYTDLGRQEASFRQFFEGARLMRGYVDYDETATLAMFEQMRTVFTPELIRAKAGLGAVSDAPIFILGMPRSGSTLVEQILASHPDVAGGGELTAFRDVAAAAMGQPEAVRGMDGEALRGLGERYLERLNATHPGATRITDKMPANFLLAGLIHLALPNARIIHTVRDPIDTCLSSFTTLFTDGQQYTYDLGELGRHHHAYARLMAHWRELLPPGVMLEVRYEDVTADPEGQARRMLSHCGLAWDDACVDFHQAPRAVWTASAAQVRRPAYRTSVGRWRPPAETLWPLLEGLGDAAPYSL